MKMALVVLVLALAPLVGAQSHDITWSDKGGARVCQSLQWSHGKHRSALRFTAALPHLIGITHALGIAAGSCLLALFLYLVLALPGVLSDRDSIVAPITVHWAQAQR